MTLIILDHAVALLGVMAWLAAGVTASLRRPRTALALLVVALVVTAARVVPVMLLAARGWWFVQEKVLLGLPLLTLAALAAAAIAGPRLLASARAQGWRPRAGTGEPEAPPDAPLKTPERGARAGDLDTVSVIALLTTAYAALAGFVLTFLVGYPLTLGVALIAAALVPAASLLTARVLNHPERDLAENRDTVPMERAAEISRRRLLGVAGGLAVAGAVGAGIGLSVRHGTAPVNGGGPGPAARTTVPVTDLRGPVTPAPGGVRRAHVLTARKATVRLANGRDFDAWTFDGTLPGPAITATQGDLIEVKLVNHDIDEGVTLHWHGYDVPCSQDGAAGVTQEVVGRGGEFVYRFRADQVGTYWYHTHHASHIGVQRGLYGTLVVKPHEPDAGELDLTLPAHTFDGTVTIAGGDEHLAPPGTSVRLRLINTDSDPHRYTLAGTSFRLVAVDGRDLVGPGEISRQALYLPAGGRFDLVFVMPDTSVALALDDGTATVWLRPEAGVPDGASGGASDTGLATQDIGGWPELDLLTYGTPAPVALRVDAADRHFTMVLDRGLAMVDGVPAYAHTVNGRGHPSIPDQLIAEGDVVRFTVVNRSLETHPWHLHGHPVLILSRDGKPASGSPLWVDTFDVRPGEVWEVAFLASNPGIWMNHCHNLPHAHQGMMLQVRYDGVTSPFGGMHATGPGHAHG
ncbi:hypothetical protein GCM10023096_57920 [Nonomuraea ferruginea]